MSPETGNSLHKGGIANTLLHPLPIAVFSLAFVAYGVMELGIFQSPDTSWHIAAGDWIIAHRRVPLTDPWSFTATGTRWVETSWLWDVFISLLFHAAGSRGLLCLTCLLGALNVAVLCACLLARRAAYEPYIVFTTALAWVAQWPVLFPLPQLVTYLFAPVFHYLLHTHRRDGIVDRRRAVMLAGMMMLWVNLHSGFVAGFTILAAYALEAYFTGNRTHLRALIGISALCFTASLASPYHVHMYGGMLGSLFTCIAPLLEDWKPFTFGDPALSAPLMLFILCSNIRERSLPLADKILAFAWLFAALEARRNGIVFTLLSAPYLAASMQELAHAARGADFRPGTVYTGGGSAAIRGIAAPACFAAVFLCLHDRPADSAAYSPANVREAVHILQADYPDVRFLNDYNLGGALILASGNTWKVFADGRASNAYPESVLQEVVNFTATDTLADDVIRAHDIHGLILARDRGRGGLPPGWQWKMVYSNALVAAYIRE